MPDQHSIAVETCQQRGCSEPAVATVRIDLGPGDARTAYSVSERVQLLRVCQRHIDLVSDHEPPGPVPSLARGRSQRHGGVRTLALPLRDRPGSEALTLVGPDESGLYALQVTGTPTGRARGLDRDHLANQVAHLLIRLEADGAAQ